MAWTVGIIAAHPCTAHLPVSFCFLSPLCSVMCQEMCQEEKLIRTRVLIRNEPRPRSRPHVPERDLFWHADGASLHAARPFTIAPI